MVPNLACGHSARAAARRPTPISATIGFVLDKSGQRLIVVSCLDNLGKGAAGQAVQNFKPYSRHRGEDRTSMKTVIKFAGALLEDDRKQCAHLGASGSLPLPMKGHEILVVPRRRSRLHRGPQAHGASRANFVSGLRVTDRETRERSRHGFSPAC